MLKIESLSKSFGQVCAVDQLNLSLHPGEIFGFLGPNGAGKTTTISMISGLIKPDSGHISIGAYGSPLKAKARQQLGVAPQALALYEPLTATENLTFFAKMYGLSGSALVQAVNDALQLADLEDRKDDPVAIFSGGMKRRLNLATAMIHKPQLLLLDEPTVGVDPQSRNALLESIQVLKQAGHTIVYTTHYMEEAQKICDRVAIMDHGKLLALGTIDELIHQHGADYTVQILSDEKPVTLKGKNPLELLNSLKLDPNKDRISVRPPDLEQVFLNLTGRQLRD